MRLAASLLFVVVLPLSAQEPAGTPKPRLELADSTRRPPVARPTPAPAPVRDTGVTAVKRLVSSSFVRTQTVLGAALYAPSFAAVVADKPVTWSAAYVVMLGGTFFAAAEIARDWPLSKSTEMLALAAPLQGAAVGAAINYAATGDHRLAPGVFFGSTLGTAWALTLGRRLTPGAAVAAFTASDAAAGMAIATVHAFQTPLAIPASTVPNARRNDRVRVGVAAASALAGLQLGAMYGQYAPYQVTVGDVQTLWTTAAIGGVAGGAFVANGHPARRTTTLAVEGGALAGLLVGDRLLVRRFDHAPSEAALIGMAGTAGALMGGGVAVLVGASARFNAATAALGAAGATGGVFLAERWMAKRPDAGRRISDHVTVTPQALAFAAARVPGLHSLARVSF